jgi:hypothetical protein
MVPVNSKGVRTYPSVKIDRLAPPPAGPAIGFRSAQLALWHRVKRSARTLEIAFGCFVAAVLTLAFLPDDNGFVDFEVFVLVAISTVAFCSAVGGLIRTLRIYRLLRRHEWTVFSYRELTILEANPTTLTLIRDRVEYPVKIRKTKRTEILRGMVHKEIWYVGDPTGTGLLTVAGGGEMFRTRPAVPVRSRRPAKPIKPRKPPKVKPIDPEKARRQAAKAAAQRAKWQEAAKARAARQRAKPPKLPRFRGAQKIKWK